MILRAKVFEPQRSMRTGIQGKRDQVVDERNAVEMKIMDKKPTHP